jgi:periplasmic divalent cation tolerance protein
LANPFRVVLMTAPRGRKAEALARGLVAERLAACVNLAPVVSRYRWEGRLRRDEECLLVVKTSRAKWPALKRWVGKNHPYAVPEVLALEVSDGAGPYLRWLAGELA